MGSGGSDQRQRQHECVGSLRPLTYPNIAPPRFPGTLLNLKGLF